jgi:dUTP pyrophosphatase
MNKCLLHDKISATAIYENYALCQYCSEILRGDCGAEAQGTLTRRIEKVLNKKEVFNTKFVLNHPDAQAPTRAHDADAGNDLYAIEESTLEPGLHYKIKTGLQIQLPKGTVGLIKDRSSLGSKGIHVFAGVIDEGFTNDISVILCNLSQKPYIINKGDRIAQLLVMPVCNVKWEQASVLEETKRGNGAFGSSGK